MPQESIRADNAVRVRELARWGRPLYHDLAWSPNGEEIAVATNLGVMILEATTLEINRWLGEGKIVDTLAYSPDGDQLAVSVGERLQLWQAADGTLVREFGLEFGYERPLFSPGDATWRYWVGVRYTSCPAPAVILHRPLGA